MKTFKKIIPKSIRSVLYKVLKILDRNKREANKYLSKQFFRKIKISKRIYEFNELENSFDSFSSNHKNFKYYGNKPYWLRFTDIELRKLGYFYMESEVVGKGIIVNSFGEVILESTVARLEYLNKLNSNHLVYFRKYLLSKKIDKAIVLSNHLANNYFHWIVESVGRLAIIPQDILKEYKIVVDKDSQKFILESLYFLFDLTPNNIFVKKKYRRLRIKETLVPTFPSTLKKNIKTSIINPLIINKINKLACSKTTRSKKSNFVISRDYASQRRIKNLDLLFQKFPWLNFHVINLEDFTFTEQCNLFANSNIIIATHGAGLVNLLFCEDPLIIEFFPSNRNKRDAFYFYQISQALEFRHHIIEYNSSNQTQDLNFDRELLFTLEEILLESKELPQ